MAYTKKLEDMRRLSKEKKKLLKKKKNSFNSVSLN